MAGCPADVSHGTVRVIEVEVIATAGSDGLRAGPGMLWRQRLEPVTHLGETNELMTQVYDAWLRSGETGQPYGTLQLVEPLVPTNVPTDLARLANQASELEPRYGIEP